MISSYEQTKLKSKYHFNTNKLDYRYDTIVYLGKFIGDWQNQIEHIIKTSKPATWETRGYKGEGKFIPQPELEKEEYDLIRVGIDPKTIITHLNWGIPAIFKKMSDCFMLDDCMERIHVQMPGEVWNLHIDKLQKWNPNNPNSVIRIMIQLTDWQPGQFWEYGNYHHHGWKAGEVTTFDWQNVPHCTANAGYHPRVTLQLTGIRTTQTEIFLQRLKENPIEINTLL